MSYEYSRMDFKNFKKSRQTRYAHSVYNPYNRNLGVLLTVMVAKAILTDKEAGMSNLDYRQR